MGIARSAPALLRVALQDLSAGKAAQAARLPGIAADCENPDLRNLLQAESVRAGQQEQRLRDVGIGSAGPDNLWMGGILDDAERDTRSTQRGRLLDIALIGAVRKAKAAEIVSSETAIALARAVDVPEFAAAASANHAEEIEADRQLKALLDTLAG